MVYLLYGDDTFTLHEALSSIKEEVMPPELRDVNITVLVGSNTSLDELVATCDTVPFMAEKRVVIVEGLLSRFERRPSSQPRIGGGAGEVPALGKWKGLGEYLSRVPETTDLVLVDGRLSEANPLLKAIRPQVVTRRFPLLGPGELRRWIRGRAADEGIEIEPQAIDRLAETIGGDLRVIAGELQKLSLYRWGQTVRGEDVDELVSYTKEANIFAAVDAMLESRPAVAIRLVHQLLQSNILPGHILAMMARQVRLLILAQDLRARGIPRAEQGKRLGLSGYPLKKTLEQERGFTPQRLVEIHGKLLEADVSIKTAGVDEGQALDVLIVEVSSTSTAGAQRSSPRYRG